MVLLLVSFISGFLTVLAPCILPVIPVVLGSSAARRSALTPYIVVASLCISVAVFTLIVKVSTTCAGVHASTWTYLSGSILILFGLTLLFPALWASLPGVSYLSRTANESASRNLFAHTLWGDILVGAALGPIFSTCSPTYFVIIATILPVSFWLGSLYVLTYVTGLAIALFSIIFIGEKIMAKLTYLSDERGYFKHILGVFFIALGFAIMVGFDKKVEMLIIESDIFNVTRTEQSLLNYFQL